jgi:peptide/nickel transport system permease protein
MSELTTNSPVGAENATVEAVRGRSQRRRTRLAANQGVGRWARLILGAIFVLWGAATLTFIAEQLMPVNPAQIILGTGSVKPTLAQIATVSHQYGFDKPVIVQYLNFLLNLAHGDLGTSYTQHQPVTQIIAQQAWPTIELALVSLVLAWVIALVFTLTTTKRGRVVSAVGSGFEIMMASLPQYWLGVILVVVFAVDLQWFPVEGGNGLTGIVLPAFTMAIPLAGFLGQVTRDEFARVLEQPFITSARARGMGDTQVRIRHALRHAVLPGITLSGWALGSLFSSAVLVETVFARQGLGQVLTNAVSNQDMPVVVGVTLLVALIYVIANLLVDIAYVLIDPEITVA